MINIINKFKYTLSYIVTIVLIIDGKSLIELFTFTNKLFTF